MKTPRRGSNIGVTVIACLLIIVGVWGETGGIYHAFKQHGTGDGYAAILIFPLSWYRGIEFFFHHDFESERITRRSVLAPKQDSGRTAETGQIKWPELTLGELDVLSAVIGKALQYPVDSLDLIKLEKVVLSYQTRAGRIFSTQEIDAMLVCFDVLEDYNRELGRCLLHSIDSNHPFMSMRLKKLKHQMALIGFVRVEKLSADSAKIIASASRSEWIDEWGRKQPTLSRQAVLDGLSQIATFADNARLIRNVYAKAAKIQK